MAKINPAHPEEPLSKVEAASRRALVRDGLSTGSVPPQDERRGGERRPLYTREILRLAASIPHVARFDEVKGVELRSPTCGAKHRATVTLDADGRVAAISQAVEACAFGQAAAALMGGNAIGKTDDQASAAIDGIAAWLAGDDDAVTSWPGLAVLDPARSRTGRHGAILLPFRALLAAIEKAS